MTTRRWLAVAAVLALSSPAVRAEVNLIWSCTSATIGSTVDSCAGTWSWQRGENGRIIASATVYGGYSSGTWRLWENVPMNEYVYACSADLPIGTGDGCPSPGVYTDEDYVLKSSLVPLSSVRIGTAGIITPDAADTYYSPATTSTNSLQTTGRPKEIVELARALDNNIDLIHEFVRNNVNVAWMYGLQKGGVGALIDRSGTPFDQAHLMVELARQANYTAAYQAGAISLSAAQFLAWTGISDAKAACQLLTSGGIPARVNGSSATSCSGVSGAVSTVWLAHVWVRVNIGGTNYIFDPSYKPHTFKAGLSNLATVAGIASNHPLPDATGGMESSSASGVPYVRNLNAEALNSRLSSYANALQTHIQNNQPAGQIEDIVGGALIERYITPGGGLRQTSLPYAAASPTVRTWTGGIPDQYRTSLRVQITKATADPNNLYPQIIDKLLYADEIYGRKLMLSATFNPLGTNSLVRFQALDEVGAPVAPDLYTSTYFLNPGYNNGTIILTVNHPYAAAADGSDTTAGNYMDSVISKRAKYATPLIIVTGFGDSGRDLVDKWGARQDQAMPPLYTPACEQCGQQYPASQGDGRREQLAASWLGQSSRAARLHAALANSVHAHHHSIGIVGADAIVKTMNSNPGGPPNYRFTVTDSFDRIDVDSAFSLTSKSANPVDRSATIHAIAETNEALEGSVTAQIADLPDTVSTATRFEWGNRPPAFEQPTGAPPVASPGPRRFYEFSSANASQAIDLAKVEGQFSTSASDTHTGSYPTIGPVEYGQRKAAFSSAVNAYASQGWSVIASEEAFLGPGQHAGAFDQQGSPTVYMHRQSKQRGGALVATRYVAGEPVEIAHVAVGPDANAKGGGGGAQTSHQAQYDPSKAADILKARFVDGSKVLGVDMQSGSVTTTSPASITVGNGGFPYELSAQLIWRGGDQKDDTFGPVAHVEPQTPWTTNWNNTLTMSGSGFEAMGESDVRAMAGTIAAFLAAQDVYKAAPSIQREVASSLIGAWWVRQLTGNVVTASVGADTRQFVKLYNGSWIAPGAGAQATLTQNGQRSATEQGSCSGEGPSYVTTRGWDYSQTSFQVTNAHGDVQAFAYWSKAYSDIGGDFCANLHGFRMSQWTFPYNMQINLVYTSGPAYQLDQLAEVNNSLGRRIVFVDSGRGGFNNGLTGGDLRTVSVTGTSADGDAEHSDPGNASLKTRYVASLVGGKHLLTQVFDVDDTTLPSIQYDYDTLRRVKEARDAETLQGSSGRAPYQFLLADGLRGERIDPAGGRYTVYYDLKKRAVLYLDELARPTEVLSDGRGRVRAYTYAEGDKEELSYDERNNPILFKRTPKPNSGLPPIQISASWNPTWNKPDWIDDARGYRTNFHYFGSGAASQLQRAERPSSDGVEPRPIYTFTYNSRGQVADATDPTGLLIHNIYLTNGNLSASTLDYGSAPHINAQTAFGYDAIGDVTSITDPRNNVTSMTYDANRRKTVMKHHNGGIGACLLAAEQIIYDVLGRVTQEQGATAFSCTNVTAWQMRKETTYTRTSKVLTEKNGASNTTTYSYDPMDRVLEVLDPENRRTRGEYDLAGQTKCTWRGWNGSYPSPASAQQPCAWDPALYASGGYQGPVRYAEYTYSANAQRLTVKDANNNLTKYEYDKLDRLRFTYFPHPVSGTHCTPPVTELADPACATDQTYERQEYDPSSNRLSVRKRDTQVITFGYDRLNRLTLKDWPVGTANDVYTKYDLAGRPDKVVFDNLTSGVGIVYAYDSAKRLTSETSFGRTVGFGYDLAGNRTRVTFPDANYAGYTFDALNRMEKVCENSADCSAAVLATYAYDVFSRRDLLTRTNGTVTDFSYDNASRLTGLSQDFSLTGNDQSYGLGYTLASQLKTRSSSNGAFDWTTQLPSKSYAVNKLNQYTTVGGLAYSHDANGNLTSDGSRTFAYDVENRLSAVSGSANLNLTYDPLGRLRQTAGSATTQFLYEGDRLVAEYNESGTLLRRYVHGAGVDEPLVWYEGAAYEGAPLNDKRYLHTDERGSVIAHSDGAGAVTIYKYGPYGEPTNWSGSRFRYTGQIALPEVALYHYKARVYDPMGGRFLQTDPVGYKDDFNLYAYVYNDPLNRTDPLGLEWDWNRFVEAFATAEPADYVDNPSPEVKAGILVAGSLAALAGAGGARGKSASGTDTGKAGLGQRAATREAKRQAGIPTSQQAKSQSNESVDGKKVGRQQTFEVPKAGGGVEEKSVQVSRDIRGEHAGQPQVEVGTVKAGGQVDAAGRPRIENESKVRVDFCPHGGGGGCKQ